jgi:hypothetical protein
LGEFVFISVIIALESDQEDENADDIVASPNINENTSYSEAFAKIFRTLNITRNEINIVNFNVFISVIFN